MGGKKKYVDDYCPMTCQMALWGGGGISGNIYPPTPSYLSVQEKFLDEVKVHEEAYAKRNKVGDVKLVSSIDHADHEGWIFMDGRSYDDLVNSYGVEVEAVEELTKLIGDSKNMPDMRYMNLTVSDDYTKLVPAVKQQIFPIPVDSRITTIIPNVTLTKDNVAFRSTYMGLANHNQDVVNRDVGLVPVQRIPFEKCTEPALFLTTYTDQNNFTDSDVYQDYFFSPVLNSNADFSLFMNTTGTQQSFAVNPRQRGFNAYVYMGILPTTSTEPQVPRTGDLMFFSHGDDEQILMEEYDEPWSNAEALPNEVETFAFTTYDPTFTGQTNDGATVTLAPLILDEYLPEGETDSLGIANPVPSRYLEYKNDVGYIYASKIADLPMDYDSAIKYMAFKREPRVVDNSNNKNPELLENALKVGITLNGLNSPQKTLKNASQIGVRVFVAK